MRFVIAATGASGALYLQRLLDRIDCREHEVHLVLSDYARQVIRDEIGELRQPDGLHVHGNKTMNVPFVSGSARFDAMAVVPCTSGTMGRIASGTSDTTILRAADVFLKERRKLILLVREMPWSLIHVRNAATLIEAGATIMPASPHFYGGADTVEKVVDTVVERVIDHLGLPNRGAYRWAEIDE